MTLMPTYGEAVLAVAREILAVRARFEDNPRLWNVPDTEKDGREWLLLRTEFGSQIHGMQRAFAVMLGWPASEGEKEGMVDVFLDALLFSEVDAPDVERMVLETEEHCRSWRPDIPKRGQ